MGRGNGRYQHVSHEDTEGQDLLSEGFSDDTTMESELPPNPPEYDESNSQELLHMDLEENSSNQVTSRFQRFKYKFENDFLEPVRDKVVDPLVQLYQLTSAKIDLYLSKLGNPLILRRIVYIIFMSFIVYLIVVSGLLPNGRTTATIGMFSDKHQLVHYARRSIDYAKMEQDLEYLSSMPHLAGTKGDFAISNYIQESFSNSGLKLMREISFETYMNYPEDVFFKITRGDEEFDFALTSENFNPLSSSGELTNANLIYAHYGTNDEFKSLKEKGLLDDNTVLLMKYGKIPSEQILRAQNFGIKGIVFISEPYGDDQDVIQKVPVGIQQFGTGDPLTPGRSSIIPEKIPLKDSELVPHIPTLPISANQALTIKSILSTESPSISFEGDWSSGVKNDLKCSLKVVNSERDIHPTWNIVGKVEGKEQSEKAIIIAAGHDATCKGTLFPNFGTTYLLSLLQLFQQIRYKYDWRPLRNIYFISFDGSMYNSIGATELLEAELSKLKSEIYAFVDISQLAPDIRSGKNLDIQTNPLLFSFFNDHGEFSGFDINVRNIGQYGDWSSFEANGIPSVVIGSKNIVQGAPPINMCSDDFENWQNMVKQDPDLWGSAGEILIYAFERMLRLADEPLIPFSVVDYVKFVDEAFEDLKKELGSNHNYESIVQGLRAWQKIGSEWYSWVQTWNNIVMSDEEGAEPSLLSVHRWTWNKRLTNIMRRQCSSSGLPGRKFYKNLIFGPPIFSEDRENDYWTFPSVRDAFAEGDLTAIQNQLNIVGNALIRSAQTFMDETTSSE